MPGIGLRLFYHAAVAALSFLISFSRKHPAIIAASKSAVGPAYMIPSMPKNIGNMTRDGSRNMICLVKARNVPIFGLPMAEKNVDDEGWMLLMNVKNR